MNYDKRKIIKLQIALVAALASSAFCLEKCGFSIDFIGVLIGAAYGGLTLTFYARLVAFMVAERRNLSGLVSIAVIKFFLLYLFITRVSQFDDVRLFSILFSFIVFIFLTGLFSSRCAPSDVIAS